QALEPGQERPAGVVALEPARQDQDLEHAHRHGFDRAAPPEPRWRLLHPPDSHGRLGGECRIASSRPLESTRPWFILKTSGRQGPRQRTGVRAQRMNATQTTDAPAPSLEDLLSLSHRLIENVGLVVLGKPEVIRLAVVALLADGHVLIEDVP